MHANDAKSFSPFRAVGESTPIALTLSVMEYRGIVVTAHGDGRGHQTRAEPQVQQPRKKVYHRIPRYSNASYGKAWTARAGTFLCHAC